MERTFTCYVIQEPINSENKSIIDHLIGHGKYSEDEINAFVEEAKTNINLQEKIAKRI